MQTINGHSGLALLAALFLLLTPVRAADKVELKVKNYAGLGDTVKQLRGKIVVVDFWADTWLICKKEFPHLVEMQRKYAKDGLAAVSVSLDSPIDEKAKQSVLAFLRKQKATFTNLILDEKAEVWQEKLKFDGPPAIFVFTREGKWKKFVAPADYADVEKYVAELIKK